MLAGASDLAWGRIFFPHCAPSYFAGDRLERIVSIICHFMETGKLCVLFIALREPLFEGPTVAVLCVRNPARSFRFMCLSKKLKSLHREWTKMPTAWQEAAKNKK